MASQEKIVKDLLRRKKMSQRQFAKSLGIEPQVFNNWLKRPDRKIPIQWVGRVSEGLGITPAELDPEFPDYTATPRISDLAGGHQFSSAALAHATQYERLPENRKEIIDALMDDWLGESLEQPTKKNKTRSAHEQRQGDPAAS